MTSDNQVEWIDALPDPERVTDALRDTGYTLETAVADLVDNSIAASADKIFINLALLPDGEIDFFIADNGHGMDREGLINALTYGSAKREDPSSLGKFGIGLKTASTAFAKRVEVTSRSETSARWETGVWDLSAVREHKWKIQIVGEVDALDRAFLSAACAGGTGTLVRWKNVDRLFKTRYRNPEGAPAQKAIQKKVDDLAAHLAMTFQRYLDPNDERAADVTIIVNGVQLTPWSPFAIGDKLFDNKIVVTDDDGSSRELILRIFVLPRTEEAKARYGEEVAAARISNKMQGIYVYREDRLIHGPDWLGIWIQEPHFTLCRVELSFKHDLDEAFSVDIKKANIRLHPELLSQLEKTLAPYRREAENRARKGTRQQIASNGSGTLHGPSNAAISDKSPTIGGAKFEEVNEDKGTATISNSRGQAHVKFVDTSGPSVFVEAVAHLDDGLLYEPAFIGQNQGVQINMGHPFYKKVYLPNKTSGTTIQALDSFLWALASAEMNNLQDPLSRTFEDIRHHVSRALRQLVEDLPEPDLSSD